MTRRWALLALLSLGGALAATPATTLELISPTSAAVNRVTQVEIRTDGRADNPFDPAEFDLWLDVSGPGGGYRIPAFWFQDYDPATLRPVGLPGWRARFTPTLPGSYTIRAELKSPDLYSADVQVQASPGTTPGFIGLSQKDSRQFAYASGQTFVPIGLNLAWPGSMDAAGEAQMRDWLTQLGRNGGTATRVWMASWSYGIEWQDTGLGDYTKRLDRAWLLDRVFSDAGARGVNIMLTLINHGAFSQTVNPNWNENPYSAANGGPLASPGDFVTNAQARELFKRRLRYIAARWGAQPNLWAWEWWNEVNWTPIGDDTLAPWIREMTAELRQDDPYHHLTTTSYSNGRDSSLWNMPELDFAQLHDYSGGDAAQVLRSALASFRETVPDKPVVLGEIGASSGGASDDPTDQDGVTLHNALWAAPFLGWAGGGMTWWWDTYVAPHNKWSQYASLSSFLQGEDVATFAPSTPQLDRAGLTALALTRRDRALLWIRSDDYTASEAQQEYTQALLDDKGTDWTQRVPVSSGVHLTLSGLRDGSYTACWYAPQQGAWLSSSPATVQGGKTALTVPDFNRDLAVKLVQGSGCAEHR